MPEDRKLAPLTGSTRDPLPGAHSVGAFDRAAPVEVTIYLRPRPGAPTDPPGGQVGIQSPALSRSQLAELRGADPRDLAAMEEFARDRGLEIIERDPPGRRLRIRGEAQAMERAFGVELHRFEHPAGSYRGHTGPVQLPSELTGVVTAVLGLDDRPQARAHFRPAQDRTGVAFAPNAVATAYGVPPGATAQGVCVALIELGGGFATEDITTYFTGLGLPVPTVVAVPVDGAPTAPSGGSSGPDAEVMLDIEIVGAVAQGANIAVYFGPNTDQGFADAISAAVHDTTRNPQVISISWGGPENSYTAQATAAFEAVFTDAALVGTTVFVAAGDNGSTDGVTDGLAHVDYPASSPQVAGCGGTRLTVKDDEVSTEVVWDDLPSGGATGGGVSATFPVPVWQETAGVPPSVNTGGAAGRGVPDVAGDAAPSTGYNIRVDGSDIVVGGTSAVAPLYAALTALAAAQAGGPVGFINPTLYDLGDLAFRDITQGTNGAYKARVGWDPCTGLGSPKAAAFIEALAAHNINAGV